MQRLSPIIVVPRGRAPCRQHQESRPLAGFNTRSRRFTDFPLLCGCSEPSQTNPIGSGLILLCLQSQSEPESHWTNPEFVILGADQKERGLWGREWSPIRLAFYCWVRGFFVPKIQLYSALRMDEPFQLANATTTESLLEIGSVLDASLNAWNEEEPSARSSKTRAETQGSSLSTSDVEPILPNCKRRVKKHLLLTLTLQ